MRWLSENVMVSRTKNIHAIIFSEALVHVGLAVILAAVLVFLCKGTIENFLSAPGKHVGVQSWQLDIGFHLFTGIVGGWIGSWLALQ